LFRFLIFDAIRSREYLLFWVSKHGGFSCANRHRNPISQASYRRSGKYREKISFLYTTANREVFQKIKEDFVLSPMKSLLVRFSDRLCSAIMLPASRKVVQRRLTCFSDASIFNRQFIEIFRYGGRRLSRELMMIAN